jgi:hypothetical protein
MNIQLIIEGHGEVEGAPVLLRRMIAQAQAYRIDINPPIRAHQSELLNEELLKKKVLLAIKQENCGGVLVLFEHEDGCPAELGPRLLQWARAEAGDKPCVVALAHREYEAWFLGAIESLRGKRGILEDAQVHPDPEAPRDAKGHLEDRMKPDRSYSPTLDQPALSALFDMKSAYSSCRSFRHLVKVFGELVTAMGAIPDNWPPAEWIAEDN